jgi:hypothetical protein
MLIQFLFIFMPQKPAMKSVSFWIETICVFLIILWTYASFSKLLDYQTFSVQLGQSPLIGDLAPWVAFGIPVLEIILAVSLAFQKTRQKSLYASFILMTVFTTYIFVITNYSDYVPCSCGGILEKMTWATHFWFNIIVTAFIAFAIILSSSQKNQDVMLQHTRATRTPA